jgi:hypothetical protein
VRVEFQYSNSWPENKNAGNKKEQIRREIEIQLEEENFN